MFAQYDTPWSSEQKSFAPSNTERRGTVQSFMSTGDRSVMQRKKKIMGSVGKLQPHKRRSQSNVGQDQMSGRTKEAYHSVFAQVSELISQFLIKTKDDIDRQKAMNA